MNCNRFPLENYSLFVLGNLPEPERDEIRSHLAEGCESCQEEVRLSQELWYAVARTTAEKEPRAFLRSRIMGAIRDERARSFAWLLPAWAGAATLALVVVTVVFWTRHQTSAVPAVTMVVPSSTPLALRELERENERLKAQIRAQVVGKLVVPAPAVAPPADVAGLLAHLDQAQLSQAKANASEEHARSAQLEADLAQQKALVALAQRELQDANRKLAAANPDEAQKQFAALNLRSGELERQVAQYKLLLAVEQKRLQANLQLTALLSSSELTLVRLRSRVGGTSAEGHALLTAGSQVVFYGSELPALPAGRIYQLWLIRAQSPAIVSAGTFAPNAQKRAVIQFASAALTSGVTAIAVTDEPAGGSEKPTGHKLLVGQAISPA